MNLSDEALRLYGTVKGTVQTRVFKAGSLQFEFDAGSVRKLSWNGSPILSGVSYLLRDSDWGTSQSCMRGLEVTESAEAFVLKFTLLMSTGDAVLAAQATITGRSTGYFSFEVQAKPDLDIHSSRCGFVVLHPASCAGEDLCVEHSDGEFERTRFPFEISPGQPVFDIRSLRWKIAPGVEASCRMEADLPDRPSDRFEMEDQRNWSDASFKTYVGSLLDPWPYLVEANVPLLQRITVDVHDQANADRNTVAIAPGSDSKNYTAFNVGAATGVHMPPIGLGFPHLNNLPNDSERQAVAALHPAWLVVQADLSRTDFVAQLQSALRLSKECDARIQLDVICPRELTPTQCASAVQQVCASISLQPQALRFCPSAYLKSFQPTDQWPDIPSLEDFAAAAQWAFPSARVGGGMLTYFPELNRKRQSSAGIEFVGHSTCPIVHAADDESVMETLMALPYMATTVHQTWPGLGWRLGPATLAAARNPYGDMPTSNPNRLRLPLADQDPRHQAQFGAAWCAGYVAAVALLGVEVLSMLATHGSSGPLLVETQPGWKPSATVPAWDVLRRLASWEGKPLHQCIGVPEGVAALAVCEMEGKGRSSIMLANTRSSTQHLSLGHNFRTANSNQRLTELELAAYEIVWLCSGG